MDWSELANFFAIGWDNAISLVVAFLSVGVAYLVARTVSGRDDRRQREAERRAVQRETVIALQDGWLELIEMLTEAIKAIQRVQSTVRMNRERDEADRLIFTRSNAQDQPASVWERIQEQSRARGEEINRAGDEQNRAVLDFRQLAKRIELLESRVEPAEVRLASRAMRDSAEAMILEVANYEGQRLAEFKAELFEPAYDRFIQAGYVVLADVEGGRTVNVQSSEPSTEALARRAALERETLQRRIVRESQPPDDLHDGADPHS